MEHQIIVIDENDYKKIIVRLPKESHQPFFVQDDAMDIFNSWNDVTGALPAGTSWHCEMESIIKEISAMAFGVGIFYGNEIRKKGEPPK